MLLQTGSQVADQAVQGILSRLDQIAAKIGTTAQQLWQVYIWQSRVEAIRDTAIALLGLVALVVLLPLGIKLLAKYRITQEKYHTTDGRDRGERYAAYSVMCFILAATGALLLLLMGYSCLGEWINPSYWAFQHLTQDLKNLF